MEPRDVAEPPRGRAETLWLQPVNGRRAPYADPMEQQGADLGGTGAVDVNYSELSPSDHDYSQAGQGSAGWQETGYDISGRAPTLPPQSWDGNYDVLDPSESRSGAAAYEKPMPLDRVLWDSRDYDIGRDHPFATPGNNADA